MKSSKDLEDMIEWAKEQNIIERLVIKNREGVFGRAMIHGFVFVFETEIDATAFKLRWL